MWVFLGILKFHPIEKGVRASVPPSYFRVVQVSKDGHFLPVSFEGFEQCGHDVVGARKLREKSTRVHPVIGRDADKPLGGSAVAGCRLKRFE